MVDIWIKIHIMVNFHIPSGYVKIAIENGP